MASTKQKPNQDSTMKDGGDMPDQDMDILPPDSDSGESEVSRALPRKGGIYGAMVNGKVMLVDCNGEPVS